MRACVLLPLGLVLRRTRRFYRNHGALPSPDLRLQRRHRPTIVKSRRTGPVQAAATGCRLGNFYLLRYHSTVSQHYERRQNVYVRPQKHKPHTLSAVWDTHAAARAPPATPHTTARPSSPARVGGMPMVSRCPSLPPASSDFPLHRPRHPHFRARRHPTCLRRLRGTSGT